MGSTIPSRAIATWSADGVWIIGRVVELVSGRPLNQVQVRSGEGGALTDALGWFRIFQPLDTPHELTLEGLGYTTVALRFTPQDDDQVFYVQDMALEPCERITTVGVTVEPNPVVLRVRHVTNGRPITGRASVSVRRFGATDAMSADIPVESGSLSLPITEGGVYSVAVDIAGFATWRNDRLIVPFDSCDKNGIGAVDEPAWLVPRAYGSQVSNLRLIAHVAGSNRGIRTTSSMLGLRRGTVRLQPHDPAWLEAGAELRSQISDASILPLERIQHIGSTAISGLPAKPILDIDVGLLDSDDHGLIVQALVANGFIDRGYKSEGIGHLLVRESEPEVRTAHVHLVSYDSAGWRRDLTFRDALRRDPSLRDRYAKAKMDLARRFPTDRTAYRHGKNAFFEGGAWW